MTNTEFRRASRSSVTRALTQINAAERCTALNYTRGNAAPDRDNH